MRTLYAYFGNIVPNNVDIPGHFIYQPFLIDEICSFMTKGRNDFQVDIYSYTYKVDPSFVFDDDLIFNHFLEPINDIMNTWALHLGTETPRRPFYKLDEVLKRMDNDYYDLVILKARFRNPSTHAKKLYDVRKFEAICEKAMQTKVPVLIVDTDLSLPDNFITDVINANENFSIIGMGNVAEAYENINKDRIVKHAPLYGISSKMLTSVYDTFKDHPLAIQKEKEKVLLYYGNIAFANYKEGHTKNYEVLEYLIKLSEEKFFDKIKGYIIGKVEDKRFVNGFDHTARYDRTKICELHRKARISVNISKVLYEKTNFNPARLSESWVYGVLPLTYSADGNYQNNKGLVFKNYQEFLECIRLYLTDINVEDYYKMFMNSLKNCIEFRRKEEGE